VIDSTPPGAEIVLSGERLGKTPFHGTLPYGERDLIVVVGLRGYHDRTLVIHPDKPVDRQVTLVAVPPPVPSRGHDDGVNPF
jgi:PEGA domain